MLIVGVEIAILAQALAVMRFAGVRARPSLFSPAASMVAVDAHALGVVFAICVGALADHALRRVSVRSGMSLLRRRGRAWALVNDHFF